MQREVPGDLGAGTSSYSVMPSNIATKFPRYFEIRSLRNWFTSLLLQQWSLWCSAFSFGNISFITFWQFVCITSFYLSLTVILTSHFSNITYFRQQQQQNKPMKYYEILPTHCETPRNTTRKIANLYFEFNYHFLTLQKKIPLLLNRSVHRCITIWATQKAASSPYSNNASDLGRAQTGSLHGINCCQHIWNCPQLLVIKW